MELLLEKFIQKNESLAEKNNVRKIAIDLFLNSRKSGEYIDRLLNKSLKNSKLLLRDRNFLTELVKGTTRMGGLLEYYIQELIKGNIKNLKIPLRYIMTTGLYQILYMDSVPTYAAINESVELAKIYGNGKDSGLVNAVLRNFLRRRTELENRIDSLPDDERISVKYSHPLWIIKRWLKRFGVSDTEKSAEMNNIPPKVTIRKNNLLKKHPHLQKIDEMDEDSIVRSEILKNYYTFQRGLDTNSWDAIKEGEATSQDVSAGIPVVLLNPQPGEIIIDLCSAPGGKTSAIAELMNDEGKILAVDANKERLSLVEDQVKRLKLNCVELIHGDGRELSLPEADRILIDAPCYGTGVLAKRSDLRWRKKKSDIKTLSSLQLELLKNASKSLKVGGVLVYSTCTIEPEENWEVIEEFLISEKTFEVENAKKYITDRLVDSKGAVATYPFKHYIDGSFCVRMRKY